MTLRRFSTFGQMASFMKVAAKPRVISETRKAYELIGHNVMVELQERIGQYPPSGEWPASNFGPNGQLAPSTIAQKERKGWGLDGNPDSPLYATGAFRDDVSYRTFPSLGIVEVGTNKEYVEYTEYGTSKMSPRPIFPLAYRKALPRTLKSVEQMIGGAAGGD